MDGPYDDIYRQSAAIPWRQRTAGFGLLMITNTKGTRWVLPKGIVEPDLSPAQSAVKEAEEEAGARGAVDDRALGTYTYDKWGGTCRVEVFLLEVEALADDWPERETRRREWVSPEEAMRRVDENDLARLIADFTGSR